MATAIVPSTFTSQNSHPVERSALLNLLIIAHDGCVRDTCRDVAVTLGYRASATESIEQGLSIVKLQSIDVVLLGLKLPDRDQLQILREIKEQRPGVEVILMSASGRVEFAVLAMKAGAYDYVVKPFGFADLKHVLGAVAGHLKNKTESRAALEKNRSTLGFGRMIGRTPEMEKLYRIIAKAAQTAHPVLISGESGTGKEMVARAIHYSGQFRDKPFVPVDCGSLAPTLIESELFGHVKGAFTGAAQTKPGLLAIAEGGTIFLDEIGELPMELQSKLLRALQEKEIRPIGSTKQVAINVRILAATNRDLEQAVAQGLFRRDLYFRLNVLSLRVPTLRERRQDIPLLIRGFLDRVSRGSGRSYQISDQAMRALLGYDWPGNVRELANCIEQCCALNSGPVIHCTDLPNCITGGNTLSAAAHSHAKIVPMADLERQAILDAIAQLNGDKLTAARLLGVGKTTLYRKLKQYGFAQEPATPFREFSNLR